MKKGFTLAEILVALAIMGILTVLTIPTLLNKAQDQTKTLYKSAFKTAETVVGQLISDINIYPAGNFYNSTNDPANTSYFCNSFANVVNTIGSVNCTTSTLPTGGTTGSPNFVTSNGMRWYSLNNTFASTATGDAIIYVDVDGPAKNQNIQRLDVLQVIITQQGKLTSPAGNETNFLMN